MQPSSAITAADVIARPVRRAASTVQSASAASTICSMGSTCAGSVGTRPMASAPGVATAATGASVLTAIASSDTSAARPLVIRSSAALLAP